MQAQVTRNKLTLPCKIKRRPNSLWIKRYEHKCREKFSSQIHSHALFSTSHRTTLKSRLYRAEVSIHFCRFTECRVPWVIMPIKMIFDLRSVIQDVVIIFQLRYDSYTIKFTHMKNTTQWFLGCATITTVQFRNTLPTPKRNHVPMTS